MLAATSGDVWAQGGAFGGLLAIALYLLKRSDDRETKADDSFALSLAAKDALISALNERLSVLEARCADCLARLDTFTHKPRRKAP